MAKGPEDRFQTGRDLLKELALVRESLSGQTLVLTAAAGSEDSGSEIVVEAALFGIAADSDRLARSPRPGRKRTSLRAEGDGWPCCSC